MTWDVETGQEISTRPLTVPTKGGIPAVSADGRTLAIGRIRKVAVELWDLDADRPLGSVMNSGSTSVVVWGGIGLTSDGRTLAVAREDGTLELWDVPTKTLRTTHSVGFGLSGIKFSPDGRTLAADAHPFRPTSGVGLMYREIWQAIVGRREDEANVIVVDIATGRRVALATRSMHPHYSPDSRTIATREVNLSVKLREVPGPSK